MSVLGEVPGQVNASMAKRATLAEARKIVCAAHHLLAALGTTPSHWSNPTPATVSYPRWPRPETRPGTDRRPTDGHPTATMRPTDTASSPKPTATDHLPFLQDKERRGPACKD